MHKDMEQKATYLKNSIRKRKRTQHMAMFRIRTGHCRALNPSARTEGWPDRAVHVPELATRL